MFVNWTLAPRHSCWGEELGGVGHVCDPAFVPGSSHFQSKFCMSCRDNGILIPLSQVRVLHPGQHKKFANAHGRTLWTAQGTRVVNQTQRCQGPQIVIFCDDPPQNVDFAPTPLSWKVCLSGGVPCVRFVIKHGTLIPVVNECHISMSGGAMDVQAFESATTTQTTVTPSVMWTSPMCSEMPVPTAVKPLPSMPPPPCVPPAAVPPHSFPLPAMPSPFLPQPLPSPFLPQPFSRVPAMPLPSTPLPAMPPPATLLPAMPPRAMPPRAMQPPSMPPPSMPQRFPEPSVMPLPTMPLAFSSALPSVLPIALSSALPSTYGMPILPQPSQPPQLPPALAVIRVSDEVASIVRDRHQMVRASADGRSNAFTPSSDAAIEAPINATCDCMLPAKAPSSIASTNGDAAITVASADLASGCNAGATVASSADADELTPSPLHPPLAPSLQAPPPSPLHPPLAPSPRSPQLEAWAEEMLPLPPSPRGPQLEAWAEEMLQSFSDYTSQSGAPSSYPPSPPITPSASSLASSLGLMHGGHVPFRASLTVLAISVFWASTHVVKAWQSEEVEGQYFRLPAWEQAPLESVDMKWLAEMWIALDLTEHISAFCMITGSWSVLAVIFPEGLDTRAARRLIWPLTIITSVGDLMVAWENAVHLWSTRSFDAPLLQRARLAVQYSTCAFVPAIYSYSNLRFYRLAFTWADARFVSLLHGFFLFAVYLLLFALGEDSYPPGDLPFTQNMLRPIPPLLCAMVLHPRFRSRAGELGRALSSRILRADQSVGRRHALVYG